MMGNQTPSPAGDAARSRSELIAALPTVRRLVDQLYHVIKPAVVAECEAPEATAIFQAVTAVQWMADALDAPDRATRIERLTEVTNRADYVTRAAHQRLAELQSLAELATDEQHCRESSLDTTAIIDGARLDVGFPNGTSATITLTVAADGRVTWQAPDVDLAPIDGPTHLGLTTALTQLGETLTKALPESAFEEQWRAGMTTQRLTPARVTLLRAVADGKVDRLGSCAYYAELGSRRRQRVTERVRTPDEAGLINPLGVAMKGGKPMPPQERFRGETVRPTCDADQRR